jgi:hypothetical protein
MGFDDLQARVALLKNVIFSLFRIKMFLKQYNGSLIVVEILRPFWMFFNLSNKKLKSTPKNKLQVRKTPFIY